MNFLLDIPAAMAVIDGFLVAHARELGAKAQAALLKASAQPSPVDKIVTFGETLYALGSGAGADAKTLTAQLIEFATRFSWHGLGDDGRGTGIVSAMQRDLGEVAPAGGWPAIANDPAPRSDIVAALGIVAAAGQ